MARFSFVRLARRVVLTGGLIVLGSTLCHAQADPPAPSMRTIDATWPPPPGEESWLFVEDLKTPEPFALFWREGAEPKPGQVDLRPGLAVKRDFPDEKGVLTTAYDDLSRFLDFAKLTGEGVAITTEKVAADVPEAYSIAIAADGIHLRAGDTEGVRRAIYHLEELIAAADGPFLDPGEIAKKPWVRNRITRCFFGPIKRPPLNRDELMDDVDYYPDAYLNRLAREGMNGLWLSVEWKDVTKTSFREPSPDMERRLAKLRRTVEKCARYGIKIWLYSNEPEGFYSADDPLLKAHPEMVGAGWSASRRFVCPNSEAGQQFIYESTRSIFSQVQGLGGMINISLGEHGSSCLDTVSVETEGRPNCPRCSKVPNWRTLAAGQGAMARGVKEGDPNAEYICWLYMPAWKPLAPWTYELGAHLPKDVTLQINFESGALKYQLDRPRIGGDYWLSFIGPSDRFARIAGQAAGHGTPMSAKLQVGCSHESATIPFMPVPSLLYGKYQRMPELGVSSVMQCWYFGNYPGVMNRAAGKLAFEDFAGTENDFLMALARPEWGPDAEAVATAWRRFADGFQHYPLSTRFQWWGPAHAAPVWPLHLKPALRPLQPTWLVGGAPGDAVGEVMDNHTLAEAVILTKAMSDEWNEGVAILKSLEPHFQGNRERLLDIGLTEAIGIQFSSAHNVLDFYLSRSRLFDLPPAEALKLLDAMEATVRREIANSQRLAELCAVDSRLGFHSEAERHQYFGGRLKWRVAVLEDLLATEFVEYRAALQAGKSLSRFAEGRPVFDVGSDWVDCQTYKWRATADLGELKLQVEMKAPGASGSFTAYLCDPMVTARPWELRFSTGGTASDSRGAGLSAEPYTTAEGVRGVALRVPSQGLQLLDPSGRAFAFNIFSDNKPADNWPADLNGSTPGTYRLAQDRFDPRRMGYLRLAPVE